MLAIESWWPNSEWCVHFDRYLITDFFLHRAGAIQQPYWAGLFLSKKMQCCPTLNGGKNCLSSALPLLLGKFSYLKSNSCLLLLLHLTEGTNNIYEIIHMLLDYCYICCFLVKFAYSIKYQQIFCNLSNLHLIWFDLCHMDFINLHFCSFS